MGEAMKAGKIAAAPFRQASLALIGVGLAALLLAFPSGRAAAQAGNEVARISAYQGPDREQRLIEGARKEGNALTFYSDSPPEDNAAWAGGFEKKYGIKVDVWRASSEEITHRIVAEAAAKRFNLDFILNAGLAVEATHAEKILQEVKSPYLADLMPRAIPAHREWVAFCFNVLVQAYNTNIVKREDLPKTYADLLDPKWKRKIGTEAFDSDWFSVLMGALGEEKGIKLFRDIAATNGFSVHKGHTLITNMVASGEVPLALNVLIFTAQQLKKKGAPFDWFVIEPLISKPNGVAVAAMAPHPHAAVLFFDYMLSDAQKIGAARDYVVTNAKVDTLIDRSNLLMLDPATILNDGGRWQKLYSEVISSPK
jgi:iron(III) transport system substrate-binding protein